MLGVVVKIKAVDSYLVQVTRYGAARDVPYAVFVYDAVGSALAESVCDEAEKMIKRNSKCRPRFSPGYGDFPLSVQRDVLSLVNAERLVGITLTDTNLMLPQKSITAVVGISKNEFHKHPQSPDGDSSSFEKGKP